VFFGRFILGLRVWASWLAGATRMHWRSFALWNALGGICWATAVGLIAYFLGRSADNAIKAFGLYGLAAALLAIAGTIVLHRRARRHAAHAEGGEPGAQDTAGAPGAQDGPGTPEAQDGPGTPGTQDGPGTPEAEDGPGTPGAAPAGNAGPPED
jgi:hypothetical protein